MKLAFDHLVHFVNNPLQAIEAMNQINLHASTGGNHEKWGTYNSLSYFGLSYIEFLGIRDRSKAEEASMNHDLTKQAISLLPHIQGFNRVALRTDQIEEVAEHARALGFIIEGPVDGERKRDDGVTIRWKMLFLKDEQKGLPLPFIIQWNQSDDERKKELHEKINAHSNGKVEIEDLVFAVREIQTEAEKWSRLFGLNCSEPYKDEHLQATCIQLDLSGGKLTFSSPDGHGFLSDYIDEHGEGPFLLRLKGEKPILTQKILGSYYQIKEQGHK